MIDDTDRAILALLQDNARISNAEMARRIELAPSAVHQRVRKLEAKGIIQGYHARIDPRALGYGLSAFVMIRTGEGARSGRVKESLVEIPEIREVHRVVGEDCFFVKVRVPDTESLGELLDRRIQTIPDVATTRTVIVVQTWKDHPGIPLPELQEA